MLKRISEIRDNISVRRRIMALAVGVSLSLVVVVSLLLVGVSSANRNIINTHKANINNMVKLSEFIENIYGVIIKSHIVSENTINKDVVDYTLQIDLLEVYLTNFRSNVDFSQKEVYDKLVYEAGNYISIIKEINSLELQEKYNKANAIKIEKEIKSFNRLHSTIGLLQKSNNNKMKEANMRIMSLEKDTLRKIYIGGAVLMAIFVIMFIFAFSGIKKHLNKLNINIKSLSRGKIPEKELPTNNNEIGKISAMVNFLSKNISNLNTFATALSKGDYTSQYVSTGDSDILGKALIDLRDNLNLNKEEENKRKLEEDIRNWTNSGHALFGEILRHSSQGIKNLTDEVIKNIVYYLSANQGGLFIIDGNEIELISAFAYDRKKFVERKIRVGDGLIGTVALEKNTIFLDEIPADYIEIESGLGDASPKNLLIVPLNFEDKILGIVEIASFKTIKPHEVKFVEELGHSIASTLLTVKINERTEQLLNDSQKQSNELTLREIEARNNMERMKATQELAKRREAALTGILSAVDNTLMKGEYELDGTLISVNDRHLQTMGYQLREIKGKNIEIFIPENEIEEFRKVWANVIAGIPRQIEVKRRTKKGEVLWLINQYTPVTNSEGEISKVLYLAHDVTRYKLQDEKQITEGEDNNEIRLQTEELKNEIEKRKEYLKQIEKEVNQLKNYTEKTIDSNIDNDIQKNYTNWLNSILNQ